MFNLKAALKRKIIRVLGFQEAKLPCKYLGIPFFMGSNKPSYWTRIIDRIKKRIYAWKARWLSFSSKIILIKSVLSAIPNYFISVLRAPSTVVEQIQKIIRGFLWKGNMNDAKNIPLVSLDSMVSE